MSRLHSWYALRRLTYALTHPAYVQSTPRPHTHPSLPLLLNSLRSLVGDRIAADGTPSVLGPVVIGVTGCVYNISPPYHYSHRYSTGKVSQGCLDLLEKLPIQRVSVNELPRLVNDPGK